ncbi:hypothetical protein STEG23_022449, partial [Scotinomys teguina]
ITVKRPTFFHPVDLLTPSTPNPSPFLSIRFQYLETCFTLQLQCPHLLEYQDSKALKCYLSVPKHNKVPVEKYILDAEGSLSRVLQRTPLDCTPPLPDPVTYSFASFGDDTEFADKVYQVKEKLQETVRDGCSMSYGYRSYDKDVFIGAELSVIH